jgi:hypothetical protein
LFGLIEYFFMLEIKTKQPNLVAFDFEEKVGNE